MSVEDSFLSQVKRVRVDLQEKVARAHQLLQERETALLSELQQLEDTYKGEGVDKQIDQLKITKEQNIATLTENDSQELLQQIVAQLDSRIKNLKDNLDAARNRMRRVELQWDCNLESILGKIGSIQVGGDSYSCYWKEALSDTIIRRSILKKSKLEKIISNLGIHIVTLREVFKNTESQMKRLEFGEISTESSNQKVIMIVGATGSGKTTLINSMINYIFGVEYEDEYRFKLEAEDLTNKESSWITTYTIHQQIGFKIPYTLTIIDTPGFGDTRGIERDTQITKQIHQFFTVPGKEGIDHIDAVGFVAQSSLPRLTFTHKYIFDQILSLFGKDIGDNIYLMLTFADGKVPQVLTGIKEAHMPYQEFFKFNNSVIFDDNTAEDEFATMFWKMGMRSFEKFFDLLSRIESKSLTQTKSVLEERERIETQLGGLQSEINLGLHKLEQLKKEVEVVEQHKADLDMNKDFTYTVEEESILRHEMAPDSYVVNCLNCNSTCHNPSPISDNADLYHSVVMDKPGSLSAKCTICCEKCSWHKHESLDYYFTTERNEVIKTSEDLKRRYQDASDKVKLVTETIDEMVDEFEAVQIKIIGITEILRKSINTLNEIALKPNPLSTGEYIRILIESEQSAAESGWQDRVNHLNEVKEKVVNLAEIAKQSFDPFDSCKRKIKEDEETKGIWSAVGVYLQKLQTW